MSSVIVIGGCITDLISYVSRFPRPGETIAGDYFTKGCGGKAANQCVMARKLGVTTAMIAKLGDDTFGHEHFENFQSLGINSEFVTFSKASHTSAASILVTNEGQNCIVYTPGAIMELSVDDVMAAEDIIKGATVLLCTYECPFDTLFAALSLARKHGVKTVLNAAPASDPIYENLYPLTDIICMNEIEAEDSTKLPLADLSDAEAIFKELHSKWCSTVILTLGAKGAIFQAKDLDKSTYVPARKVEPIDSTGAGDAFMGALVYFLSEYPDMTLQNVVQRSCEIATLSVLNKGTQSSFPNREDIPKELFD